MVTTKFFFIRFLRQQDFFKNSFGQIKDYVLFVDAGKHFKCYELLHYLFYELAEEKIRVCKIPIISYHKFLKSFLNKPINLHKKLTLCLNFLY